MVDIGSMLTAATLGGLLLTAVFLGLFATMSLYAVMLLREVAIVAFVVFAPIALASWTWSATRHWLRRRIEVVGALVFSKVGVAVVFALGISATGNGGSTGEASIGSFLAGVVLFAMAAMAPLAAFTFIHWQATTVRLPVARFSKSWQELPRQRRGTTRSSSGAPITSVALTSHKHGDRQGRR